MAIQLSGFKYLSYYTDAAIKEMPIAKISREGVKRKRMIAITTPYCQTRKVPDFTRLKSKIK